VDQTLLPETARAEVRRLVLVSRAAGVCVGLALALGAFYVHRGYLGSREALYEFATVAVGLGAFIVLSTVTRLGHARILEQSLQEVQKLSDQLREMATADPLTGLLNLRAFQERIARDLEDAARQRTSLSLIVADLDNFKLLNDSFGHAFGDAVLRRTAEVFAAGGTAGAYAARLGGDEFAVVLPGCSREEAARAAGEIERALADLRIDGRQSATLGSFGVGTYPDDGATVQSLFAAADGRMYSEKHHRKAENLSSLAGASRKLFVSVGAALRPDRTTAEILDEIAAAARTQFALSLVRIAVRATDVHPEIIAVSAASREIAEAARAAPAGPLDLADLRGLVPPEAWAIDAPIPDESGAPGSLSLTGLPASSFRPDARVVLALADLIQAIVANGRAHVDAQRAGRERDIHIELARALAGGGTLDERLSRVAEMLAEFMGATSVAIEGLARPGATAPPFNIASGADPAFLERWVAARNSPQGQAFLTAIADETPCIIPSPADDLRIPATERKLLRAAGISASAIAAIRFEGDALGMLAAVCTNKDHCREDWLQVLSSIADHLAPVMKVALLSEELQASYEELERASRESLARLAQAAEARDPHTGGHLRRIQRYSEDLALELGLSAEEARAIGAASAVHDLGKLQLPDQVLLKPGRLDAADWAGMKKHPEHGEQLIGDSPMFEVERCVARWHHERWDGSGYPDGLAGEQIPLPARIVAVADAFDALTTMRLYKPAWPLQRAYDEIVSQRGALFCPDVVAAFERLWRRGRLAELHAEAAAEGGGEEPERLAA
jgi:diguanylate cyclase (GGDEF)-like protein